jgi:hypothetical protein
MKFLTPVLRENLDLLKKKIRLPDYTTIDSSDLQRRARVIETGALLPGLRMCERRTILLLAQSAPLVELANLLQTLEHLVDLFEVSWEDMKEEHENILERCRDQLNALYKFAEELEEISLRREEALRLLELIDTSEMLNRPAPSFEPVFPYLGYEVSAIAHSLNATKYPDAIIESQD